MYYQELLKLVEVRDTRDQLEYEKKQGVTPPALIDTGQGSLDWHPFSALMVVYNQRGVLQSCFPKKGARIILFAGCSGIAKVLYGLQIEGLCLNWANPYKVIQIKRI